MSCTGGLYRRGCCRKAVVHEEQLIPFELTRHPSSDLLTSVTVQGNVSHAEDSPGRLHLFHLEGDHSPRHVHVYRNGRLILKWDLDHKKPMEGKAPRRILKWIDDLESEGLL